MEKTKITIEQFGKDHWSTFAYIECRCVDNKGILDNKHMRCDADRHPAKVHVTTTKKYPTRLKGYFEKEDESLLVHDHDDWDCADDLEEVGLIKSSDLIGTGMFPVYELTDRGKIVAGRLRAHKASDGMFANFEVGSL